MRNIELRKKYKEEENAKVEIAEINDRSFINYEYVFWLENMLVENLSLSDVSQQRELLPDFLYKDDYGIKIGYHGDTEVSEEWNDYLKKLGNSG